MSISYRIALFVKYFGAAVRQGWGAGSDIRMRAVSSRKAITNVLLEPKWRCEHVFWLDRYQPTIGHAIENPEIRRPQKLSAAPDLFGTVLPLPALPSPGLQSVKDRPFDQPNSFDGKLGAASQPRSQQQLFGAYCSAIQAGSLPQLPSQA